MLLSRFVPLHKSISYLDANSSICSIVTGAYSHRGLFSHYCWKLFALPCDGFYCSFKFIKTVESLKFVQKSNCKSKMVWFVVHTVLKKTLTLSVGLHISSGWTLLFMMVSKGRKWKLHLKKKKDTSAWAYCPVSLGYIAEVLHFFFFVGAAA